MKQVRVEQFGDVAQLRVVDAPEPVPGAGELVVEIAAAGVGYADLLQREGVYVGGPRPPFVPGSEAAGTVVAHGDGVTAPPLGARVLVIARGGLHAERAAVPAASCLALPAPLDFTTGAAFGISYLTAYHALTTVAHARAGELVVIHAAAGGLGTAAVQLARLLGLTVIATASTEDKRARVRALGAELVVDYDGWQAAVRDRGGAAIVLDSIGGDILRKSLAILAPLGRLVLVGLSSKQAPPLDSLKLIYRSRAVLGLHLDAILGRPDLLVPSLAELTGYLERGELAVQVGQTFPLAEVARAHELLANRGNYGKLVLVS
jgi:NADPH2:quinone reductase